ncbi:MAG TPA: FtsQ-type POTRA domain-containing protein [Chloroflexi bacterium]|nr:FtsQ-type POTRA domain-containing protein [Chloroflexota bacterium]
MKWVRRAQRGRRKLNYRPLERRFEAVGVLPLLRGRHSTPRRRAAVSRQAARLRRAGLVLALVLVLLVAWVGLDDRFYVFDAEVIGAERVSAKEVFRVSGLTGWHVLWVRPAEVEARILAALPSLKAARVKCRLPATCTIEVKERQPRVMWNENDVWWWVDESGVVMHAQGALPEGWVVYGPLPRDAEGRLDERVRVALEELSVLGMSSTTVFTYVPGRGLVFTNAEGWRVVLGEGAGMADRLAVLEPLTAHLKAEGITPRFVDVRFVEAPYYSVEVTAQATSVSD